eukprot:gene56503-75451_t
MITIAELPEYIRRAEKLMSDAERLDVVNYLAAQPKAGDLMEGTGGVRKLRWGRGAKGKSGGVRVIYYVHSDLMPLYLLTLFAKNERANLSKAERNELADLVELLGLNEAIAHAKSKGRKAEGIKLYKPHAVDVSSLRERLSLTQEQFAARFGFSVAT